MHRLKILPNHYVNVARGDKRFEIRDNSDRGFQRGDIVELKEINPNAESEDDLYTGRSALVNITYVSNYEQRKNFVVFGFTVTHLEGFEG